jgi:hypothetical protein
VLVLLLHAAIVTAAATAIATTAGFMEPRIGAHLLTMPGLPADLPVVLLIAGSADGAGLLDVPKAADAHRDDVRAVGSESLDKISEVPLS